MVEPANVLRVRHGAVRYVKLVEPTTRVASQGDNRRTTNVAPHRVDRVDVTGVDQTGRRRVPGTLHRVDQVRTRGRPERYERRVPRELVSIGVRGIEMRGIEVEAMPHVADQQHGGMRRTDVRHRLIRNGGRRVELGEPRRGEDVLDASLSTLVVEPQSTQRRGDVDLLKELSHRRKLGQLPALVCRSCRERVLKRLERRVTQHHDGAETP